MSDFLHNLVARSLAQIPIVKPRPASRFEPVHTPSVPPIPTRQDDSFALESDMQDTDDRPPMSPTPHRGSELPHAPVVRRPMTTLFPAEYDAPQQPLSVATPPAPSSPRVWNSETLSESDPSSMQETTRLPQASQGILSPRPAPLPVRTENQNLIAPPTPLRSESIVPLVPESARRFSREETAPNLPGNQKTEPTSAERPQRLDSPHTTERGEETKTLPSPVRPAESVSALRPVVENTIQPRILPRPAPPMAKAPSAPAQTTPAPPLPTIQVTIGRIEIRAVPAMAPVRSANTKPSTPVMSLDDYLRHRKSGGQP